MIGEVGLRDKTQVASSQLSGGMKRKVSRSVSRHHTPSPGHVTPVASLHELKRSGLGHTRGGAITGMRICRLACSCRLGALV
jgi:hypothetical protein